MTFYVGFEMYEYEGCSEPIALFDDVDKAVAWVKENKSLREFVDLEVE
jgi:hypothetical protein